MKTIKKSTYDYQGSLCAGRNENLFIVSDDAEQPSENSKHYTPMNMGGYQDHRYYDDPDGKIYGEVEYQTCEIHDYTRCPFCVGGVADKGWETAFSVKVGDTVLSLDGCSDHVDNVYNEILVVIKNSNLKNLEENLLIYKNSFLLRLQAFRKRADVVNRFDIGDKRKAMLLNDILMYENI